MKRILVGSDLSPGSANALARAIKLADEADAAIRILHSGAEIEESETGRALHRRVLTEARIMVEELGAQNLDISAQISATKPATAILTEAERFDSDLIVLGAHGEPRFRDALFGTTATHVVRHSDRPVLVVQNDAWVPYSKVMLAIDDVKSAPAILDVTLDIAPISEVFAVHAFYPSLRTTIGGGNEIAQEELRQEKELETLLAEMGAGQSARKFTANKHAIVERGEALRVVMDQSKQLKPDLIAMGTRRRTAYLGSHAVDTLFAFPGDVLIVPEFTTVGVQAPVEA